MGGHGLESSLDYGRTIVSARRIFFRGIAGFSRRIPLIQSAEQMRRMFCEETKPAWNKTPLCLFEAASSARAGIAAANSHNICSDFLLSL
jgi:hypothetical protein